MLISLSPALLRSYLAAGGDLLPINTQCFPPRSLSSSLSIYTIPVAGIGYPDMVICGY